MYTHITATALIQQSNETCAALDRLISTRNVENTGSCTRNDLCTVVTCIYSDTVINISTILTFTPCKNPISVHDFTVTSYGEILIDVTTTENISVEPYGFPNGASVNLLLTQTKSGVMFGVRKSR